MSTEVSECAPVGSTGGPTAAATCAPEWSGPAHQAQPAWGGGVGDDAVPELLDWGSIEDEDGAFGQLTGQGMGPDLHPAETEDTEQDPKALAAVAAGAFTLPARLGADAATFIAAGGGVPGAAGSYDALGATTAAHGAQDSTLRGGDPILRGATKSLAGKASAAADATDPLDAVAPSRLSTLQCLAPDLATSLDLEGARRGGAGAAVRCTAAKAEPAEETRRDSDNTGAACGARQAIMASGTSPASATASPVTRNIMMGKVTQHPPHARFIASELHRPEVPNMPIRGSFGGARSYSEVVRWRPPAARVIA